MNDSSALRRERRLLVLLGLVCLGLLGGALYLQYVKHEDPCTLCIIQRYLFLAIAICAFAGAAAVFGLMAGRGAGAAVWDRPGA